MCLIYMTKVYIQQFYNLILPNNILVGNGISLEDLLVEKKKSDTPIYHFKQVTVQLLRCKQIRLCGGQLPDVNVCKCVCTAQTLCSRWVMNWIIKKKNLVPHRMWHNIQNTVIPTVLGHFALMEVLWVHDVQLIEWSFLLEKKKLSSASVPFIRYWLTQEEEPTAHFHPLSVRGSRWSNDGYHKRPVIGVCITAMIPFTCATVSETFPLTGQLKKNAKTSDSVFLSVRKFAAKNKNNNKLILCTLNLLISLCRRPHCCPNTTCTAVLGNYWPPFLKIELCIWNLF